MANKVRNNTAIILAGGKGLRVGGDVPKQYLLSEGEPMVMRSLRVFEASEVIDSIVLVVDEAHLDYGLEMVKAHGLTKVKRIVSGGKERYDSVYNGLLACESGGGLSGSSHEQPSYVFIHDSARPFITEDVIARTYDAVRECRACVAAVPAKDTIKIADESGLVEATPPRNRVWIVQTPQVFDYELLMEAYSIVKAQGMAGITDDAMIMERSGLSRVRLVMGDYANVKVTTPEDLRLL